MDANLITAEYFDDVLLEMRNLDAALPDTTLNLFGRKFRTPVMTAALSHLKGKDGDGMEQMALGASRAGAVCWCGMGDEEQFAAIMAANKDTIRIIKPYSDESDIYSRMEQAEALGALAVGMDVDHSWNAKGEPDNVLGHVMRPMSSADIAALCRRTKLPFVVKGVLSAVDARKCLDAGVSGIVVSHHHGILPSAVPPLMVLQDILKVVDGKIPVFVDCGFSNGVNAFKALAMGVTAVSIGRVLMQPIAKNGAEGARETLEDITAELAGAMAHTGTVSLENIDRSILWSRSGKCRIFPSD